MIGGAHDQVEVKQPESVPSSFGDSRAPTARTMVAKYEGILLERGDTNGERKTVAGLGWHDHDTAQHCTTLDKTRQDETRQDEAKLDCPHTHTHTDGTNGRTTPS